MILSFSELIDQWPSVSVFADDVGVPYGTAKAWKRRNSIPASRWAAIITAATERKIAPHAITLERLTMLAQEKRVAAE